MTFAADPAQRFREVATGFACVVAEVSDWNRSSPVSGWRASDIVWHLTDWPVGLFSSATSVIDLPARDQSDSPPLAWANLRAAVQTVLADEALCGAVFSHPQAGEMTAVQALDMLYTPDVFMHTWDLARAAGVDVDLDADYAAQLLAGMLPIEARLRTSGHYGKRMPVERDADAVKQLMAFIGRETTWVPQSTDR